MLLNLLDFFKIIVPLSIVIATIIKAGSIFFNQTEIDKILSTQKSKKWNEVINSSAIAVLFSLITLLGLFTDLPFFQNKMIELPFWNEFNLAFIYLFLFIIGCFLFYVLLLSETLPFLKRMELYKKQMMGWIAKVTYFLVFPPALLIAFSIRLNFAGFSIESILLAFFVLTVFYAFLLIYLAYLNHIFSNKKRNYYLKAIAQSEVNELLKKLYLVSTLDKQRFILSDRRDVNEYTLFTPIYIYNHATNTLNIIDEVNKKTNDERSRLQTHSR